MFATFSKHPKGLPFLFFTELWERFGYYLMIGIFVLYMEDSQKGGLGMLSKESTDIYGTFIALNYYWCYLVVLKFMSVCGGAQGRGARKKQA